MAMRKILFLFFQFALIISASAQTELDSLIPVRGVSIAAPQHGKVDKFNQFVKEELFTRKVNTLLLRVDYNYEYQSNSELRDENPLTREEVKKIVKVCQESGIRIIPQVNLFGHQSWASKIGKLLEVYPQFDETPHIEMPTDYVWPNEDGLYCKSYCPLHPDVHGVVFDIVDEIVEVFEADAFHAGLDEVFYIGDDKCPRCSGRDKAELFAGEVRLIRNHLAENDIELWIWGDRLIDGKTTGLGMWEASMNNTHRAIDMIPKDVVINDWHYVKAVSTDSYFATKGFRVISCPFRIPEVAVNQLKATLHNRENTTPEMKERYMGVMLTVWSSAERFMDQFYANKVDDHPRGGSVIKTFHELFDSIGKLEK